MKKKTTIYDIARYLKISPASVSYVLNNKPKVSKETKEAVLKAIKELGYSIDYKGVALSTGKTRVVALFLPSNNISSAFLQNQFFAEFIGYFQNELESKNYDIVIKPTNVSMDFGTWARNRGIDSAVFIGVFPDKFYRDIIDLEIPIVLVDVFSSHSNEFINIRSNDENGMFLATNELIENGHKNIAFISGDVEKSYVDKCRFEGFKRALTSHNIKVRKENLYNCVATFNKGVELANQISSNKNITAVVCAADAIALGLMKGLSQLNYSVPKDISIVGFDDISTASLVTPSLTTINQHIENKAKLSAKLILSVMNGEKTTQKNYVIEPALVKRDSVNKI